ncbi:MAG: hypothetical protein JWL59_1342 [Chthoniobacteraceae bacterium]|nr:hypothetical protein [Chthoniobacteraceae bacterium]
MKTATILFTDKGKPVLLFGPDTPFSQQRAAVQKFRNDGLPKGIVLAEIWERKKLKCAARPPAPIEEVTVEAPKETKAPKESKQPIPPKAKPADEIPVPVLAPESAPVPPPSTLAEFIARNTPPADELGS